MLRKEPKREVLDRQTALDEFRNGGSGGDPPRHFVRSDWKTGVDGKCGLRFDLTAIASGSEPKWDSVFIYAHHPQSVDSDRGVNRIVGIPPEGKEREVMIDLEPARTIRGKLMGPDPAVSPSGDFEIAEVTSTEPKKRGELRSWSWWVTSVISKDYEFEIPRAPRMDIRIVIRDKTKRFLPAEIVVPAAQDDIQVPMKLNPDWQERANILLRSREPDRENFYFYDWDFSERRMSDFAEKLESGTEYLLRRRKPGKHTILVRHDCLVADQKDERVRFYWESDIQVPQSGTVELEMSFRPGRPIKLTVVTKSGGPPPRGEHERPSWTAFRIWDGDEKSWITGHTLAENGTFAGRVLPPGRLILEVHAQGFRTKVIEIGAEAEGLDTTVVLEEAKDE